MKRASRGASPLQRSTRSLPVFFVALGIAGAAPAGAAASPPAIPAVLTLDRALELLRARSFDLALADETVRSAAGDAIIAGARQNPVATFSVGRSFFCPAGQCNGAAGLAWVAAVSDQALIENTLSGKRALKRQVARAAHDAARFTRHDVERSLEFQLKQQFLQVLLAREQLRFAEEARDSAAATFALTERRYQAGAISEADLAKIEVAQLEAEQAVDNARQGRRAAHIALAQLLGVRGVPPEFEVEAPELLRAGAPPRLAGATQDALLREALARRPDLRAAGLGQTRAAAAVALARRLRFPDIAVSVQYSQEGAGAGAITPPTVSFGLSAPLPLLYRQRGEIQKAEADRRTQELQRARLEAQVAAEVGAAYSAWRSSASLLRRMDGRLLERARRARDLVLVQYRKGATSLLEYLDAQRTFIAINVEYLQNLSSFWTAVFQLEQAVGGELRR